MPIFRGQLALLQSGKQTWNSSFSVSHYFTKFTKIKCHSIPDSPGFMHAVIPEI